MSLATAPTMMVAVVSFVATVAVAAVVIVAVVDALASTWSSIVPTICCRLVHLPRHLL